MNLDRKLLKQTGAAIPDHKIRQNKNKHKISCSQFLFIGLTTKEDIFECMKLQKLRPHRHYPHNQAELALRIAIGCGVYHLFIVMINTLLIIELMALVVICFIKDDTSVPEIFIASIIVLSIFIVPVFLAFAKYMRQAKISQMAA